MLQALTRSPFEPMNEATLEYVTKKTVFLVALGSGRRRSEIHAMSADKDCLRFAADKSKVTLLTSPGFLAKNQPPDFESPQVVIPALSPQFDRGEPERLLCPVRALRFYLEAALKVRKGRKTLFVPFKEGTTGEIRPHHVSRWIQDVVHEAYVSAQEEDQQVLQVSAHEVRAFASSWRMFNRSCSIDEIMQAAFWRSDTTFTKFYLREMCGQALSLYSLGPLVVGQAVVEPPKDLG